MYIQDSYPHGLLESVGVSGSLLEPPRCLQMLTCSPLTPDVSQMPQRDFVLKKDIW